MPEYGMTPQGFIPKRLAEIQHDLNESIANIVDPRTGEFPFQNISDDTLIQQIVGLFSEALAECWNAAYAASTQFDPLKNFGAGQSGTVQLNAISRKPGAPTILRFELTGVPNTVIPAGSIVATTDNVHRYQTLYDAVINAVGTVRVTGEALNAGSFVPAFNTVVKIPNPIPGWTGVNNIETMSVGTYEETDEALRIRQQRSTALTSYRLIEAIYAAVANIPGVLYCRAYQNPRTQPVDERGIPFKEVAVIVEGGEDTTIAEALYLRFPTGQIGYGTTTVQLFDRQGFMNPISFSRPQNIEIYVNIKIRVTDPMLFPDNGAELIKEQICSFVEYVGRGENRGFAPGSDVVRTRLFTPINRVPGHSILDMTVGKALNTQGKDDIVIAWNEVARFDPARINIVVED